MIRILLAALLLSVPYLLPLEAISSEIQNRGTDVRISIDDAVYICQNCSMLFGFPINLNQAGRTELESLPYIGVKRADAIISFREENGALSSLESLTEIKGIGAGTIEKIRPYVRLQ